MNNPCQRIIHLTDCHLFADKTKSAYGVNPWQSLNDVIHAIESKEDVLLVLGGDLTNEHDPAKVHTSYQQFGELIAQHFVAQQVYWLPGNHDDLSLMSQVFDEFQFNSDKTIALSGWQVQLVVQEYEGTIGILTDGEIERLTTAVDSNRKQLLFTHHPLSLIDCWIDKHKMLNPELLLNMLKQLQCENYLIHGHIHAPMDYQLDKLKVLGTPSSCWQWHLTQEFAVNKQAKAGCREISLYDNGLMETQVITV